MPFVPRRAQQAGIDVAQVLSSWRTHLLADRDKHRANPRLAEQRFARLSLTVLDRNKASCREWEVIGGLPEGVSALKVQASTFEAARNKTTLAELLEARLRRQLAERMQAAGLYGRDLEGRRQAMARAMDAYTSVTAVDMGAES